MTVPTSTTAPPILRGHDHACGRHPSRRFLACPDCWDPSRLCAQRGASLRALDAFLGAPFRHQGRAATGVDCSGLAWMVYTVAGLPVFDIVKPYPPTLRDDAFLTAWRRSGLVEVRVAEARPGSVALVRHRGALCHAVFLTDRGSRIHASLEQRAVVERPLTDRFIEQVAHTFDHPDLIAQEVETDG